MRSTGKKTNEIRKGNVFGHVRGFFDSRGNSNDYSRYCNFMRKIMFTLGIEGIAEHFYLKGVFYGLEE
jgi:hypothetical protein